MRLGANRHVPAEFYFDDGERLCGVYSATLNVMRAILSPDRDAPLLWADLTWEQSFDRKSTEAYERLEDAIDTCTHEHEHVIAFCDHRGGMAWHGTACRRCLLFFGPYVPDELGPDEIFDIKSAQPVNRLTPAH